MDIPSRFTFGSVLRAAAYASGASSMVLAAASQRQVGSVAAATNATSHWVFAEAALVQDRPSLRYTPTGYAIHHLSSTMWALVYERFRRRGAGAEAVCIDAVAIAAAAFFCDYTLTPKAFSPGFERRVSLGAVALAYAAFAAGLALSTRSDPAPTPTTRRGTRPASSRSRRAIPRGARAPARGRRTPV